MEQTKHGQQDYRVFVTEGETVKTCHFRYPQTSWFCSSWSPSRFHVIYWPLVDFFRSLTDNYASQYLI